MFGKITYPSKKPNLQPWHGMLKSVRYLNTYHKPLIDIFKISHSLVPFISTINQWLQIRHSRKIYKSQKHTQIILCKGKYSIVTFKVDKTTEQRHGYCLQDKVYLIVFFNIIQSFQRGKKKFSVYITQTTSGSCWNVTFQKGKAWWKGKGGEEESKE